MKPPGQKPPIVEIQTSSIYNENYLSLLVQKLLACLEAFQFS